MIDMYGSEVGVGNKVLYENSIFSDKKLWKFGCH